MEESLKTARLIHQLIILVSATLIAFALSVEPETNEYDRALREFRTLAPTLDEISSLHIQQTTEDYKRQGVLAAFVDSFKDLDTSSLRLVGVQGRFGKPVYGAGDRAPIADLHRYLLLMEGWERLPVWDVDIPSLRKALEEFRNRTPGLSSVSDILMSAERPPNWDGEAESYDGKLFSIAAHCKRKDQSEAILNITGDGIEVFHKGIRNLKPETAIKLVRERGLVVERDGQLEALPALRDVWDTVGALDVGAIEQTLARKSRDARRSAEGRFELLGLKIKASTAIIVGPLTLVTLLAYLLAHVLHIHSIRASSDTLLREFPWVALFDSLLSRLITRLSLTLLPITSVIWLVLVSNLGVASKAVLCGMYSVAMCVVCIAIVRSFRPLI